MKGGLDSVPPQNKATPLLAGLQGLVAQTCVVVNMALVSGREGVCGRTLAHSVLFSTPYNGSLSLVCAISPTLMRAAPSAYPRAQQER